MPHCAALQEMKELGGLIHGGSETESRDYWKKEMEQAIREIAQMYEDKMTTIKNEMEISCNARVSFRHCFLSFI